MAALTLIAAVAENGVIGLDGGLPWHIPRDLRRFKRLTRGHPVIMGRKTFETLPAPLPDRRNIVITRQSRYAAEGVDVVSTLEQAMALVADQRAFVVGGSEIYRLALSVADRLDLTKIHAVFDGDTVFPPVDWSRWREVFREDHAPTEKVPWAYSFTTYERV